MLSKSIQATNVDEIEKALVDSLKDGFKPTLAIIFISLVHEADEVDKVFSKHNIQIYGASSNGSFIDEDIIEKPISVLLLDVNPDYFQVYTSEYEPSNPKPTATNIAQNAKEFFDNPIFLIIGSHLATNADELLRGFQEVIGADVEMYGAMAGDDYTFNDSHVFSKDFKSYHGIVAIAFNANKII